MKISGSNTVPYPAAQVWDALLDPAVLVRTIPGCERLEATGENAYAMTVTAGVAAIKGTYSGSCSLSDLQPHDSLVMKLQGAGAPGTVDATVDVSFAEADGSTTISYAADAVVGGMVGGVGQRMLASVSRRMAGEFFGNVAATLSGGGPVARGSGSWPGRDRSRCRPGLHRARARRHLLAGRLPQGHRRRGGPGAARRARRPPRAAAVSDDLTVESSALAMAAAVARKDISARELMDLHLARIAERNPELNAIVSLDEERAREGARAADEHLAGQGTIGPLARAAVRGEGHARRSGVADDVRIARCTPTTCPTTTT